MRASLRAAFLLLLVSLASSCAALRQEGDAPEQPRTTVEVRNQNFLDMNVYVLTASQRLRLGTVTGLTSRTFTLPRNLVFGHATLRFEMDPIGSRARPVSQEITVAAGEHIVLVVPNF